MTTAVAERTMTESAARRLVNEINNSAEDLAVKIRQFKEGRGWKALGYDSWKECCEQEFKHSAAWACRKLKESDARKALPMGNADLPERTVRELRQAPQEQWTEILDEAGPAPTAAAVREVVQRRLSPAVECDAEPSIEGSRCVAVGQRDDEDIELAESELTDADACDPANDLGTLVETTRDAWLEFLSEHPNLKAAVVNRFDLFLDELKEWEPDDR